MVLRLLITDDPNFPKKYNKRKTNTSHGSLKTVTKNVNLEYFFEALPQVIIFLVLLSNQKKGIRILRFLNNWLLEPKLEGEEKRVQLRG